MSAPRAETREYFVPGRVELVGKHVDYAGGRSLTIATELAIHARATAIDKPVIRLRRAAGEVAMDVALSPNTTATGLRSSAYVTAVARRFARDFPQAGRGVAVELQSNLPTSAGLSSSTALIVTLAMAFVDANDLAKVARGESDPWTLRPYAVWSLNFPFATTGATRLGGPTFMTAGQREFIEQWEVEAYRRQIASGQGPPATASR